MAVNERTRHALYEAARRTLGDEPAETLMEMLPPTGWADVATKHDLAALREWCDLRIQHVEDALRGEIRNTGATLRGEIQGVRGEIQGVRVEMRSETNRLILWLVPLLLAYGAALVRLG